MSNELSVREKKIISTKNCIERLSLCIESENVFEILSQICSVLIVLAIGDSKGIKPYDAEGLMYFIMRMAIKSNGNMDSQGEHTDALRRYLKSLGINVASGSSAPKDTSDLDTRQILAEIALSWDDVKDDVYTYYVLMYITRYSKVNEHVVTEKDKKHLEKLLRILMDNTIE